ncbi:hypothetical protein IV102_27745 [bacterium]|nr:hypothetical protein [bacterium]
MLKAVQNSPSWGLAPARSKGPAQLPTPTGLQDRLDRSQAQPALFSPAQLKNVQEPPAQQPSPYPRPMTDEEKTDFKSWFPALDVDAARVTHEATPQYNCISWTTGNTQSWDWPPSMYDGNPVECFTQYYTERGFSPVSAEEAAAIGKDKELVAYWEDPNGPTHGSVSGNTHGQRWESKCGQAAQIQHGRDELESEVYGKIAGYWVKTGESQVPVREIPGDVQKRLDSKLALKVVMVDPKVAHSFDEAYSQWQTERKSPKMAMSSNPKDYLSGQGYQKMVALGQDALPLWIQKMRSGDFFCQYAVQELTKGQDGGFEFKGVNPQPELRAQEKRVSEQDKANQIMVQWLDSQW